MRKETLHMDKKITTGLIMIILSATVYGQIVAPVKYHDKWGFIDLKGNWFIESKFDSVGNFYNYYAEIYVGEKQGLINHKGEVIIKPIYDFVGLVEDDMADIMDNEKVGYFNVKNLQIIEPQYEDGNEFSEGLAGVKNENDKWGFIDSTGTLIIPFKYDNIDWYFENDSIEVELNSKEFYINKKDEIIGEVPEFKYIKKELSLDEKRNKLKKMNKGFDTLSFQSTGYRQDSIFWYRTGDKYGIADTTGLAITQPIFDYIWYFSEGLAPVQIENKWGFIFPNGQTAIKLKYEKVLNFKYGLAAAKYKGKWGYINHSGKWVIKPIFENTDGNFRDIKSTFDPIVHFEYE